jgi:Leucine-rich repeat (LRR) protein
MSSLKHIYANGNNITYADDGLPSGLSQLKNLKSLNIANNAIEKVPEEWQEKWGSINLDSGVFDGAKVSGLMVNMSGNNCY